MRDPSLPVVLVTGASSGLGLAIARELMSGPFRVMLTARAASLHRFAAAGITPGANVLIHPLDVTIEDEREQAVAAAESAWGGIDMLVNNAGIAYRSVIEHFDHDELTDQMNVNFEAPLRLIQLVLPRMRERGAGRIVNVSSVGGMLAMPTLALYSASKFALEGASEALWYELRPFGIHVTLVQPGFIRSDSFRNTRFTQRGRAAFTDGGNPYHAHYRHMDAFIARLMGLSPANPDRVARTVARILTCRRPPLRVAATPDAHVFAWLRRFLPRQVFHRVLYSRLPGVREWAGRPPDSAANPRP